MRPHVDYVSIANAVGERACGTDEALAIAGVDATEAPAEGALHLLWRASVVEVIGRELGFESGPVNTLARGRIDDRHQKLVLRSHLCYSLYEIEQSSARYAKG